MLTAKNHSETFKIKDATSYDGVSGQFDVFTEMLSQPFAERMIRLAELQLTDRVLDVGTGTGIVAFNAGRAVPKGRVVGVDLSEGMLATAAQKATRLNAVGNTEFFQMDAESLKFDDRSFDVVLSLYALLHFPNPSVALAEMFRVLRPGGRLVLAVGGGPALLSPATVLEAMRRVKELLLQRTGRLLVAPAFLDSLVKKYLPGSIDAETSHLSRASLNRASGVLALVREAKFQPIRTCWYGHRERLETAEVFWEIQSTFSSLARKRLLAAPPDKIRLLRKEFFEVCHQVQARRGHLIYPRGVFFIKAQKPPA